MGAIYPIVSVNGVSMRDEEGRWALHPDHPPRTTNIPSVLSVAVPGRDGSLRTPQGAYPSPLFTVVMVILGTGDNEDTMTEDVDTQVQFLTQLASTPVVKLRYQKGPFTQLFADARIHSISEPEAISRDVYKLTMIYELFGPFWWATENPITETFTPTNGATLSLSPLLTGTAPIIDAQHLITGPATNPKVTDLGSGDWWQYTGVVAAGQKLRFDASTFRATLGSGVTFTTDGTNVSSAISVGGSGFLIPSTVRITPAGSAGVHPGLWECKVRVDATALTSASRWEVRARKAHL